MKLYLFKDFAKRKNSTKQPALNTASKVYDVYLKVTTDYDNPTFVIADSVQTFPIYTYAYLQDINRYYFVGRPVQRNAKCWEIDCRVDIRATYKAIIKATTAYVAYSSSNYSVLLNDSRVPKLNATRILNSLAYDSPAGDNNYDYLWVAGENGVVCYRCNLASVTSAVYQASVESLLDNLCQSWSDIQSCILYCRSYSLHYQSSGSAESVKIGKYDTGVQGVKLSDSDLVESRAGSAGYSIAIPHTYTDFRRFAFSTMKLSLPYVGVVNLAISDFVEDPAEEYSVHVEWVLNIASGVLTYKIANDEGSVIATYNGVVGRAKPVSIYTPYNGTGVLTSGGASLAGAAAVAVSTGPVGMIAGIGGAIAGIAGMISATSESSGTAIGTNDGSSEEKVRKSIQLTVEEYESAIEPETLTAIAGRPCGKVLSLANLTGYVQTVGASVSVNATSDIIDALNAALDEGLYLE